MSCGMGVLKRVKRNRRRVGELEKKPNYNRLPSQLGETIQFHEEGGAMMNEKNRCEGRERSNGGLVDGRMEVEKE